MMEVVVVAEVVVVVVTARRAREKALYCEVIELDRF